MGLVPGLRLGPATNRTYMPPPSADLSLPLALSSVCACGWAGRVWVAASGGGGRERNRHGSDGERRGDRHTHICLFAYLHSFFVSVYSTLNTNSRPFSTGLWN
jgi:hypothetical protein